MSSYSFTNVTANHTIAASFTTDAYTITASAGSGGTIDPSGSTQVNSGGAQTYIITPNTEYSISDVLVDGSSVGVVSSYSFTNVTDNHTIAASFTTDAYTITASAGSGGTIDPSGSTQVNSGGAQTYIITPNTGYSISDVLVDGSSVGAVSSYSFTNVTDNHTIAASFATDAYTITASAGSGGTIDPSGSTQVNSGGAKTYTITPNTGYSISDVLVDGSSVGAVSSYSFTNVTDNHTIAASFAIDEQDVTAPTVTNLSPQADAIQVPQNTLVILNITDSGAGVDANLVTIKVNDDTVYSGNTAKYSSTNGECYRLGTKANYTFIYQSNEMFDFDQPISVDVNATDLADNVMAGYSYSFKTEMRSFGLNKTVDSSNIKKGGRADTVRDGTGNIWATWHAGVIGKRDIYIAKLSTKADNFGNSIIIRDNSADQYNTAVAVGSDDKLYVAWQDNRRGNWDIYISTSNDGTNWSPEIRITDSNDNQINPAIVVDNSNNASIVWEDDRNGNKDIYIATSSNAFLTKAVSQITTDSFDQFEPAIAADSSDTVYVVWTDKRNNGKNDIYGAASNNTWTNIPVVTEGDSQSKPAIATEAAGSILHLVWVDDRPGDDDIYYASTSDGLPVSPLTLTGSSIIDDTTNADQLNPVVAVIGSTGSNLHVFACWQDERNPDDDLYLVEINSGSGTNVFVGDDGTNSGQADPAIGTDGDGYPYLVWTDSRNTNTDIYYAGSTIIGSTALASSNTSTSSTVTVGTPLNAIDSVDDVSVVVPAGAYPCDIKITISEVKNFQEFNLDFSSGLYEFSPSGIEFLEPVTITIPYEVSGSKKVSYKAYWYNSLTNTLSQEGITDVQTIVISPGLHALQFKTTHFTPFILGGGVVGGIVGGLLGGGGGGGCSMSLDSQASAVELLLPYVGLAVALGALNVRDRWRNKARKTTKSEC
ncbi:MAG: hypothetical protein FVQ85_14845 [Planctomycetes bacterium]|nr:hypothetical protein [Planctomycetota bacterium]